MRKTQKSHFFQFFLVTNSSPNQNPRNRNAASKIAGQGIANPTGLIYSTCNLLRSVGYDKFGDMISRAVKDVYREGKYLTADAGGSATTKQFTDRVIRQVEILRSQKGFD